MRINWITLRIVDMEASKKFYGEFLGMETARTFDSPEGMHFAFFQAENGMQVELIEGNRTEAGGADPNVSLGVAAADYDRLLARARETGILTAGPMLLGGHLECFFVKDPDGNSVQVARQ